MSLPPQLLRIKRKRDVEPVDSLYIESSPSEKRRRDADQDYVFRRISNVKVAKPIQEKLMPRIIPTLPGREDEPLDVQKTSRTRRPDGLAVDKAELGFSTQQPRRFFLSKPRGVVQSQDANKKRKTAEYAVFVENQKPAKTLDRPYNANEGPRQRDELGHGDLEMIDAPQRRPGASSRSRCASHTPNLEASDGPDQATINAILQYAAEEHRLNGANHDDSPHHVYDDDKMDESEIDYVYDTFVRHESTKLSSTMDTTAASGEGIGYLVIDEEDREYWEGFGEDDDESEQDWDSEQDDENAENYYGADYPEEEVDSDDEYDRNLYRYRHGGASDEEESNSTRDDHSDSEDADRFPWKDRSGGASTDSNDSDRIENS